jgi:hypothetical protein
MMFGLGVALLLFGAGGVFIARERADGSSILRVGDGLMMIYPVFCLVFIAFGIALIVFGS